MSSRAQSKGLEEILYQSFPVLDKGFIRIIDYMGNDQSIVQAARVSYGKGTKTVSHDKSLIDYLMKHNHTTPFEMCEIKLHIKMPIFVARQWLRHRTASVNEYSARYSIIKDDFYLVDDDKISEQSNTNKQGRKNKKLTPQEIKEVSFIIENFSKDSYSKYQKLLNKSGNREGIARELARMLLTLNYYTEIYWKIDLHNLLHFLTLRIAKNAQYEIRAYALEILKITKIWVPYVYEAFEIYKLKAITLSQNQIHTLKYMLQNNANKENNSDLNKREWQELVDAFF
ncbi:MAG: FAD-dependent thymidylate synthase [Rickettsia sp.]|nr:FAD-dependent thymidylate synthase [Rickettsia sp.]